MVSSVGWESLHLSIYTQERIELEQFERKFWGVTLYELEK
jgi:hypothetical protein